MRARVLCLLALCLAAEGFAAKRDFKGLFGSYRRERFTENEGRPTDYGMDILLSTLLPLSSLVNSSEGGGASTPLSYATFFNVEGSFFFTLNYHWQLFLNVGFYSYDTRKQNSGGGTPQFHLFTMEAFPVLAGAKYRFGVSDIVPYVGAGAGLAFAHRRGFYDYSTSYDDSYSTGIAAQVMAGVEFFVSPRVGIRLEIAGMYMALPSKSFAPGVTLPTLQYQPNPIAMRYASGLFLLF